MSSLALAYGWYVGWAVGALVVLVAAVLLLVIVGLARRIAAQATAITEALDGARENTLPLWDVRETNRTVHNITRRLGAAREMLTR